MKKKQKNSIKLPGVQAESYAIVIKSSTQKELLGLAKSIAAKVIAAIDKLSQNPRPTGVKKLKGSKDDDFYRIRVTDYGIIYTIEDEVRIIEILKVGHRKDIYR
jgi:mRNA interferase RelE/StbE